MIEHYENSAGLPGAWARCACGWTTEAHVFTNPRRSLERHMRTETELELLRARTRQVEEGTGD